MRGKSECLTFEFAGERASPVKAEELSSVSLSVYQHAVFGFQKLHGGL